MAFGKQKNEGAPPPQTVPQTVPRAELRMRCLEAAMNLRTPGTNARAACDIAQAFFDWVNEAAAPPENTETK